MYCYPRLSRAQAQALVNALPLRPVPDPNRRAATVPVGGIPAPPAQISAVRDSVLDALGPEALTKPPSRHRVASWDAAVGRALHDSMRIIPSDAASEGVWSYLTLCVMPDLAVLRFPERHASRLLGVPRNTFRRTWWRIEVIGELEPPDGSSPLGEDELVQILERSAMARNRRLARALAEEILSYRGVGRADFARALTMRVRRQTGVAVLDTLSEPVIHELVTRASKEIQKP